MDSISLRATSFLGSIEYLSYLFSAASEFSPFMNSHSICPKLWMSGIGSIPTLR